MKLITKIYLSIGFILLVFISVTITFFFETQKVDSSIEKVLTSTEIVKSTVAIHRAVISVQTGLRGYILADKESFLEPYYEGQAEYLIELNLLRKLCTQKPEDLKLLNNMEHFYIEFKDSIMEPLLEAHRNRNSNSKAKATYDALFYKTYNLAQGKIRIDKIKNYLKTLENRETLAKNKLIAETRASHKFTQILGIVLTALAILAGIITTLLLGRTINKRITNLKILASNLAQENFEVKIEESTHDELSSLSRDMNIMAKKLKKSFTRLNKMNQELDQFAYVVSHDLKAPLRAINNLAEWIEEDIGTTTPEIKSNLNLMRGRVLRMENLINGILDYARVGRKKLEKSTFPVQTLLHEITESLDIPAGFKVELPQTDLVLTTEKILLHQVLANLIGNGIKYNDKQEGIVKVNLSRENDHMKFSVNDNGPGIPKEFHEKVFGVFQTIEARDTKESTGIGLAIVKKIVEEQGCSIWLESEINVGSTFYFTWPLSDKNKSENNSDGK